MRKVFYLFFLCLTIPLSVPAQWQLLSTLPTNSKIYSIYFLDKEKAPQIGFAVAGQDLFKSTNRGKTWKKVLNDPNTGYPAYYYPSILGLSFKDSLIGWTASFSLYSTTDGGETWTKNVGLNNVKGNSIYYNKLTNRIFLSVWNAGNPCLVSTNEGVTWSPFSTEIALSGYAFADDGSVGISASGASSAWVYTSDGGISWNSSQKKGETWQPLYIGENKNFLALSESSGQLEESMDGGASWRVRNSTSLPNTGQIAGRASSLYYQSLSNGVPGFNISIDTGFSWASICGPSGNFDTRFYVHNDTIYSGSENSGEIWINTNPGIPDVRILPNSINLGSDTMCNSISFNDTIYTGCADFQVVTAELIDTSAVTLTTTQIPLIINHISEILHLEFKLKKIITQPYATTLRLICKKNSFVKELLIPVTINSTVINPNQFNGASYKIDTLCKTWDSILPIVNPFCDTITITSLSILNSSHILSNLPVSPFEIRPEGEAKTKISIDATSNGDFIDSVLMTFTIEGATFSTILPIKIIVRANIFSLQQPLINFDTVSTCATLTKSTHLINNNCDSILITEFQAPTGSSFIKTKPSLPLWLHTGDSLQVEFIYSPTSAGAMQDSITFLGKTVAGNSQYLTLVLSGYGDQNGGVLFYSPKQFVFKSLSICEYDSASGTITNVGCDSLLLDPAQIFGDPDFKLTANSSQLTVQPQEIINYEVYLNPAQKGFRQGRIVLTSDGAKSDTVSIPFTVTVTSGTKILTASQQAVDFGTVSVCDEKDSTITLTNSGCDTLWVSGSGFEGLGFGSNAKFPIMILPGHDTSIDVFTVLDTAGGKTSSTAVLSFVSDADSISPIRPINLQRTYSQSANKSVGFYLDPAAKMAGDQSIVNYDIKESGSFAGANIDTVTFDLAYNTDLLEFGESLGNHISFDGLHYIMTGTPIKANANGILAKLGFRVYLTKDSVTKIELTKKSDTVKSPCGILSITGSGSARFDYNFLCGERSISGLMNGFMSTRIVSLRPNPATDEIIFHVESAAKQDAVIEIINAIGARIYYQSSKLVQGTNNIRLDTKTFSDGVYIIRLHSSNQTTSQSFVKVK
jgi:photosystem II stability/assembly factor-like uncharacterized protein